MIIGSDFLWLHLPKTGGTSSSRLFNTLRLAGISVDPEENDSKHDSIRVRQSRADLPVNGKRLYITSRRLPAWLLSDWHHKTMAMGLSLPFEPVRSGLFYSLRLGGLWVSADHWLQYFEVGRCDAAIRLEQLELDANRLIHPHLPIGTPRLQFPHHNSNRYSSHLGDFFSRRDLNRIYACNPLWSAWEEQVYGSRTELPLPERLRSLRRRLR